MSNQNDTIVSRLITLSRSTIPNEKIAAIQAIEKAKNFK